ncbi:MAG: methylenetetrahydrofolate reductase [Alphaproteobacteria bacterium]|nr:MAG: methylenetetrahydrofolate reductase [Alphaproteobacteria bacterium]
MPEGARVYIAALPNKPVDGQVEAASRLRGIGLEPVPHLVARSFASPEDLDRLLGQLVEGAAIERALVLGGDRDDPAGNMTSALDIIRTGLLEDHGIRRISIGCYPEGHPRISDEELRRALHEKLEAADKAGLETILVSQFCFDPNAILNFVRDLRADGINTPIRIGVAGPAKAATLIKYAMICGVGPSLRALKERQSLARNLLGAVTPEDILRDVAVAREREPELRIWGIHFFTFAALRKSIEWAEERIDRSKDPDAVPDDVFAENSEKP